MKSRPARERRSAASVRRGSPLGTKDKEAATPSVDDASLRALARALLALAEELIEREAKWG
jgi:hypothetical protein